MLADRTGTRHSVATVEEACFPKQDFAREICSLPLAWPCKATGQEEYDPSSREGGDCSCGGAVAAHRGVAGCPRSNGECRRRLGLRPGEKLLPQSETTSGVTCPR